MFESIIYYCSILVYLGLYGAHPTTNELVQLFVLCEQLWIFDVIALMPLTYLIFETYDLHYIVGHIV
uniref:Uncharacterized protein n=1 Tax=Bird deltacoronavirus CalidrisCN24 TaxID=3237949 RepID=A0AB39AFX8_9NIDO